MRIEIRIYYDENINNNYWKRTGFSHFCYYYCNSKLSKVCIHTTKSPLIIAFSHDTHPLGPIVLFGPRQPFMQFLWHGRHSPVSLYLVIGQNLAQDEPSRTCLHSLQCSGPGPLQIESHSSWHSEHWRSLALYSPGTTSQLGRQRSLYWKCLQDTQRLVPGPQQPSVFEHSESQTSLSFSKKKNWKC